jgi:hypothetical protein
MNYLLVNSLYEFLPGYSKLKTSCLCPQSMLLADAIQAICEIRMDRIYIEHTTKPKPFAYQINTQTHSAMAQPLWEAI